MPAPSASGFDLLCRNTTIATADRQQTNATTITALVVARMPKFIVGPQPVGTSRVFPQPARRVLCKQLFRRDKCVLGLRASVPRPIPAFTSSLHSRIARNGFNRFLRRLENRRTIIG